MSDIRIVDDSTHRNLYMKYAASIMCIDRSWQKSCSGARLYGRTRHAFVVEIGGRALEILRQAILNT